MSTRIESQPAYILHSRKYRDTSLILECLTADFGRVSGVLRGARANSKSAKQRRGYTQPFVPLLMSWTGKSELKTITLLEARATTIGLQGAELFSALYVNELITRLLLPGDEQPEVYTLYEWVLRALGSDSHTDVVLRRFELKFLEYLGYEINFSTAYPDDVAIMAGKHYSFHPEQGFSIVRDAEQRADENTPLGNVVYLGDDILAIGAGQFTDRARTVAKRLCREALAFRLGGKPIRSRELFK